MQLSKAHSWVEIMYQNDKLTEMHTLLNGVQRGYAVGKSLLGCHQRRKCQACEGKDAHDSAHCMQHSPNAKELLDLRKWTQKKSQLASTLVLLQKGLATSQPDQWNCSKVRHAGEVCSLSEALQPQLMQGAHYLSIPLLLC